MVQCNKCHKKSLLARGWGIYKKNFGLQPINYCPECHTILMDLVAKTVATMSMADEITKKGNLGYLEREREMNRLLQPCEDEIMAAVDNGLDISTIRFLLIPYLQMYNTHLLGL